MFIRNTTLLLMLFCSASFSATDKAEPTTGFNIIGYIQTLTIDDLNDPLTSAKITVNGTSVIIPKNLKIVMPGTYLTANDLFRGRRGSKATPAGKTSCIALDDRKEPSCKDQPEFPYTAEIVGNIVGKDYIAGLVNIGQIPLQTSSGFIKKICYKPFAPTSGCVREGEFLVGPAEDNPAIAAHVRLNDPKVNDQGGRFGAASLPEQDDRFKADQDNPTVHAATGYPVCIPRVDPGTANDPLCPKGNRKGNRFTIGKAQATNANNIPVVGAEPCKECDPHAMVPLIVGDYIVYTGTLQKDTQGTYISASALEADIGVYTSPKTDPAYVAIEEAILGAGGSAFPGIDQETGPGKVVPGQSIVTRFRIVGFTTDPSRNVDVFALDVDKAPRLLSSISPEPNAPMGRFRVTIDQQVFMPPPREIRAQISGIWDVNDPDKRISAEPEKSANGLTFGRYDAPVGEYIFPEGRVFGGKLPEPGLIPANFEDLCFLSVGSGKLDTLDRDPEVDASLPIVGKLMPWPDSERKPYQVPPSAHQPPGTFCK
jgi:hypothetical protein